MYTIVCMTPFFGYTYMWYTMLLRSATCMVLNRMGTNHEVLEQHRLQAWLHQQGRLEGGDQRAQRAPGHSRHHVPQRAAGEAGTVRSVPRPQGRERSVDRAGSRVPEPGQEPEEPTGCRGTGEVGQGCHPASDPVHLGSSLRDVMI